MGEVPKLISIKDGCALLGCHPSTIYRLYDRGEITLAKVASRRLIPMSEIERLTEGTRKTVAEPVREPKKLRFLKRKLFPKVTA